MSASVTYKLDVVGSWKSCPKFSHLHIFFDIDLMLLHLD